MLQKEFGGILKISPQLFSKSHLTSKDLYRVNVSFRLLDVKKGEVIKIDEKVVKITSIDKKIRGIDLLTAKKKNFDLKERYKKLETAETVVVKTKPKLEVLHPETYQSTTLENPVVTKKEKVVVAVDGNKLWLVE